MDIEERYISSEYVKNALEVNILSDRALSMKSKWKIAEWVSDTFDFYRIQYLKPFSKAMALIQVETKKFLLLYFPCKQSRKSVNQNYLNTRVCALLPKNLFLTLHFILRNPYTLEFDLGFGDLLLESQQKVTQYGYLFISDFPEDAEKFKVHQRDSVLLGSTYVAIENLLILIDSEIFIYRKIFKDLENDELSNIVQKVGLLHKILKIV